jgi:hypothetical protein
VAQQLDRLDRPIHRHPGHHLGVGEVPPRATDLPDALVRVAPAGLQESQQSLLQVPDRLVVLQAGAPAQVQGVHHLAVDVELELVDGAVADPHRPGLLIAGQPVQLLLGDPPLAGHAVQDLHLPRLAGDGPQQPLAPRLGLVDQPGQHQRRQGEGRVPQPAVAVVPVADPAELLGQRGGGGGDDAAGGGVGQRLQGEQGAEHRVLPATLVSDLAGPLAPPGLGVADGLDGVDPPGGRPVRGVPGEHERDPFALGDGEVGQAAPVLAPNRHRGAQPD